MRTSNLNRVQRLLEIGKEQNLDWILCTLPENIFYFSGFRTMFYTRFIGVLVATRDDVAPVLIASFIDAKLIKDRIWSPHWFEKTVLFGPSADCQFPTHWDALKSFWDGKIRLGVDDLSYAFYAQLVKFFPKIEVQSLLNDILQIRIIKEEGEIDQIRKASGMTEEVIAGVPGLLQHEITEADLAAELNRAGIRAGAEALFYPTLVSCGEKMLALHSPPLHRPIRNNELVRIAFALQVDGYGSDVVRTFCRGTPPVEILPLRDAFFEAQEAIFEMLRPGRRSVDLVNKVGEIYRKRSCEKYWARNVGHGIALTIHEPPWIAGNDETVMNENMVVAIEPFLMVPPLGAFAHCDVVRVTAQGCERLSPGLLRGLTVV